MKRDCDCRLIVHTLAQPQTPLVSVECLRIAPLAIVDIAEIVQRTGDSGLKTRGLKERQALLEILGSRWVVSLRLQNSSLVAHHISEQYLVGQSLSYG